VLGKLAGHLGYLATKSSRYFSEQDCCGARRDRTDDLNTANAQRISRVKQQSHLKAA